MRPSYGPTISKTGALRFVSPSQIKTAQACVRKWWWEKVQKKPTPQSPAQVLGETLHAEWENHLKSGAALGPMAFAGKGHEPAPPLLLEHPIATYEDKRVISAVHADGIPVIGFVDILHEPGVVDIKTTSDAKWAKTPYELAQDLQMVSYGLYHHHFYRHTGKVELRHWYFKTRAPYRSWTVDVTVTQEQLEAAWEPATKTVAHLKTLTQIPVERGDDVPANTKSCGAYGGCPHRSYCSAGAEATLVSWFGTAPTLCKDEFETLTKDEHETMAKFQKLSAAAAIAATQLQAAEQPSADGLRAKHLYDAICQRNFGAPPLAGEAAKLICGASEKAGSGTLAQIEPLATLEDLIAVARDVDVPENVRAWVPPPAVVAAAAAPAAAQVPPVLAPPPPPQAPPTPPPNRAEVLREVAVEVTPQVEEEPTLTPPDMPKRPVGRPRKFQPPELQAGTPVSVAAHAAPFALYINAMPLTTEAKPLYPYVLQITKAVSEAAKVVDVRLADKNSALAFGGWRGAFTAAVVLSPPPVGVYFIDTMGNEIADVVAHALIPVIQTAGGIVVKGLR